jgi:hypothetical protein
MANLTDTHTYDGKLVFNTCTDLISIAQTLSLDQKREKGRDIRTIADPLFDPMALHYLDVIINDIGTADNIDTTNNLVADDLLCLCWEYRNNSDFMKELELQLLDMNTGFCPQGKTHRLFQILEIFSS